MNNFLGFTNYGTISKKRRIYWETQLIGVIRNFSDGITFFNLDIEWDRYKSDHTPAFRIELTIFNLYNHIWIYQNNFHDEQS